MKIGILGTGVVGKTLGAALSAKGHEIKTGSRSGVTFADAAAFGEVAILCVSGAGAVEAATSAAGALGGKIVIDTTNPLDFSKGFPPSLFFRGDDSLGEQVQKAVPDAKVVKALNTVNANLMTDASRVAGGEHDLLIAGNDLESKTIVQKHLADWFGWKHFIDLGDITGARASETYLALWVRLYAALKTPEFSIRVVK
ncbi:MAG TPA: NADP oxidoreductase [Kofleriaceae bacterium]|jgi:predicted dinucleotide-binding enzyme|nr:NADP oxidoreductase [Kofleriaceae bacterium]